MASEIEVLSTKDVAIVLWLVFEAGYQRSSDECWLTVTDNLAQHGLFVPFQALNS